MAKALHNTKRKGDKMRISTTLRREIRRAGREDGVSLYAIARDANLNYSTVHGFARGTKNLNMESIDAICSVLGGSLVFNGKGK